MKIHPFFRFPLRISYIFIALTAIAPSVCAGAEQPASVIIEYFIDSDPGIGKATQLQGSIGTNSYSIPLTGIPAGVHTISTRACDSDGNWSATVTNPLYITEPTGLESLEYYIDTDPGEDKGTPLTIGNEGNVSFAIPTAALAVGDHKLVVRGKNANGTYFPLLEAPFTIAESSGIVSVIWDIDVRIMRENSTVTIEGESLAEKTCIEVYAMNGMRIAGSELTSVASVTSLELPTETGPFIVTITSPEGKRFAKRIL